MQRVAAVLAVLLCSTAGVSGECNTDLPIGNYGYCRHSPGCCDAGLHCYEQNSLFAQCRPEGQCPSSGWTCTILDDTPPPPAPESCTSEVLGEWWYCGHAPNCCIDGTRCYQRDSEYAQCRTSCPQGRGWTCVDLGLVPTPAPETPVPEPPSDTLFRVTTGSGNVSYGTVATIRVFVHSMNGAVTEVATIAHPESGEVTLFNGTDGMTAADVKGLEFRTTHPDGWFIASVDMWVGTQWERLGLPLHREQEYHWIDSDNERTPETIYFSRKAPSAAAGSNAFQIRITTGTEDTDGSDQAFPVRVHYGNSVFYDVGTVSPAQPGQQWTIMVGTAPRPASEIDHIEVYDTDAGGHWFVASLELSLDGTSWVAWELPAFHFEEGHMLDSRRHEGAAKVLRFHSPTPADPAVSESVSLRITTGAGPAQGSTATFPLVLRSTSGVKFTTSIAAPLSGEARLLSLTGVPMRAEDIASVKVLGAGADDWFVSSIEVDLSGGARQTLLLKDHHYTESRWVCGECDDGRAVRLTFVRTLVRTPAPTPVSEMASSNTVRVRITTGSEAHEGSTGIFKIALQSKTGKYFDQVAPVVSPRSNSVTVVESNSTPFPREEIGAVWIFQGGAKGWKIVNLEVEQSAGNFIQWKTNGNRQAWIDSDNPEVPQVLVWTEE